MDPRRIFITLDDQGKPKGYVWALISDPADFDDDDPRMPPQNGAPEAARCSWSCALTAQQVTDGWTAVPSEWRRVPDIAQHVDHANGVASLVGRKLRVGGVELDLDERGNARGRGQEPDCPCGTLVSQGELQSLANGLGRGLAYQDATTGAHMLQEPEA